MVQAGASESVVFVRLLWIPHLVDQLRISCDFLNVIGLRVEKTRQVRARLTTIGMANFGKGCIESGREQSR